MYTYISEELPNLINKSFHVDSSKTSITGYKKFYLIFFYSHSMGGHGALMIALKNPNKFKSVSAFSPITHFVESKLGAKTL
jgi:S-formylglutathione hydrolase